MVDLILHSIFGEIAILLTPAAATNICGEPLSNVAQVQRHRVSDDCKLRIKRCIECRIN